MEKIMPSVCIIIPNWNSKEHLRECLLSLSKLDYTNYKIIVVDNGSTDGSVEMVRASFPHVTLLANSQNLGFAKAVNLGIQASKEEYIALLNNDTVVNPHWLSSLVSAMQRDPKVGLAGGKIYYYELEKVFWGYGGKVDLLTGLTWNVGKGEKDAGNYDYDYIPACALIIKRETIEKIGFFDEEYFAYFEDTDLNIRARMFGYNVLFIPEALVWHKALSSKIRSYPKRKLFDSHGISVLTLLVLLYCTWLQVDNISSNGDSMAFEG